MRTRKSPDKNLFFSKTWPFLNEFLIGQSGRSPATVESYRDSLTIFKNYLVRELGRSIADFQFSDCTKECIYNFREHLLRTGSQPSTVNVRVAAIRSYLKYVADTDISVQSVALAVSLITPCKKIQKERKSLVNRHCLQSLQPLQIPKQGCVTGLFSCSCMILLSESANSWGYAFVILP